MIEKIVTLDKELFVFLNTLGSPTYDELWLILTNQLYWTPLFLLLLVLSYKKLGVKQTLLLILFVALLVLFTDQITNLFKHTVQRLRPCNNPELKSIIRIVQQRNSFSYFSGHAANSMAVTTLLFLIFRTRYNYFGFLFLWPLLFAYSRIYLGLHFPLDILSGYLFGLMVGFLFYKLYQFVQKKYF